MSARAAQPNIYDKRYLKNSATELNSTAHYKNYSNLLNFEKRIRYTEYVEWELKSWHKHLFKIADQKYPDNL